MTDRKARRSFSFGTDPDAFEVLYRDHVADVQRFLSRRVADPSRVADLTAEVFLAAIESADSYHASRGTPIAWLYGVARNVVAGDHRRTRREREVQGRLVGRRLVEADDLVRLEERIDAEAQRRSLYHALTDLPESERAVLELVWLDDLAVQDAATALGISAVSARVRLHRARKRLRSRLPPTVSDAIESHPHVQEVTP